MTPDERNLITGLFDRLRKVNPGQKDQEAEQLIQQSTTAQPDAAYLLVQTLLVQEHALNNAQVRIQQLEKQAAQAAHPPAQGGGGGGFLSGLFGHHADPAPPAQPPAGTIPPQQLPPQNPAYTQSAPPYPSTVGMAPGAGGGFLRSALTTAAGVAGGAALFQGIESLLGHNSGPFGPGLGGGGFFGGGGGYGGGYGGPEVIENREVVNNYIDERGGGGDRPEHGSFLGGGVPGFQQTSAEDNRQDAGSFNDSGFNTSNPFDAPASSDPFSNVDDTPPTDDASGNSLDNTYDSDNTDAGGGGGDFGGGNDDSSNV